MKRHYLCHTMKGTLVAAIAVYISVIAFAQETVSRYESGYGYGLYNRRTNTWVSKKSYQDIRDLGNYSGLYFYAFKSNNLWGVMTEKGQIAVNARFENIGNFNNGFFTVKMEGSWGLADVYGHIIVSPIYQNTSIGPGYCQAWEWRNSNYVTWRMDQLVEMRDRMKQEDQIRRLQIAREAQEKRDREKKERELASFMEYARAFVEPRINDWQKKGEFEKLATYQLRVTGPNRTAMIDSLTRVAEKMFITEHASLKLENEPMTLDLYDSENEAFFIESAKLGKMVVHVPISEGPDFKIRFLSNAIDRKNPVFYINDDKIALASLEFRDNIAGKSYYYNNRQALNYNHYDIDPDTYKFELVNVVTAKLAEVSASNPASIPKRPIVSILYPEKNSIYQDSMVRIRYQATVYDGSTPTLHVWVNGMKAEATPVSTAVEKGVAPAWKEIELVLPKDKDHLCNIMLSVTDGSGFSSENKTVSLKYVGDLPKPKLHLFSVGISDYTSSTLSRLSYASKDAQDFVSSVTSSDVSMYETVVTPTLLTNKNATKSNIEKGLADLTRNVRQDDVVMLFFSGHGVLDGNDAYFMSVDAVSGDPYTGVDFALIRKNMSKMKDKKCRVVIFMDACYSGAMFNTKSDLKTITFAENDIIGFYSSTASQTSAELSSDSNGLFTKALVEGMSGKAKNKDGEITTLGLQKYISDYVNSHSRGRQSPVVENKQGDIILYKIK